MNLSELQEEIVTSTQNNIIVLAAAASGKTRCLTERVKWLLDQGVDPSGIVVFTFTNAAAEVMRSRLDEQGSKVFINTIHSYANLLLITHGYSTRAAIDNENFDELFELVSAHPDCINQVEYLLLDEAQDSNELQLKFIFDMIKPQHTFIVGDVRQSIYGFNGARPDLLMDLIDSGVFEVYDLNENYRNGESILKFAKGLIRGTTINGEPLMDTSICMKEFDDNIVVEVEYSAQKLVELIKKRGEYKDWFVLARSNRQVDELKYDLERYNIPCDTFKRAQLTTEQFTQKMNENTVKVLTVHTSKGLEAPHVAVFGVGKWSKDGEERRIAYVAATRAIETLIWFKRPQKKKMKMF